MSISMITLTMMLRCRPTPACGYTASAQDWDRERGGGGGHGDAVPCSGLVQGVFGRHPAGRPGVVRGLRRLALRLGAVAAGHLGPAGAGAQGGGGRALECSGGGGGGGRLGGILVPGKVLGDDVLRAEKEQVLRHRRALPRIYF